MNKYNKDNIFSSFSLSMKKIRILMPLMVLIFFIIFSSLSWFISEQAESTLRDQQVKALNSIVQTTHKSIQKFWLQKHKPIISQWRSEEHTSELQSHHDLVCRLLLEKKN